jgi:hypothetical protein
MSTPDEKLDLAKQWKWMHAKVASGDWPSGEEVRTMAPLVYEWLRQPPPHLWTLLKRRKKSHARGALKTATLLLYFAMPLNFCLGCH